VQSVSSGTDDAVEATEAVMTTRGTTGDLRVGPQQVRARVIESREQAAPSGMAQDPAATPVLLEESKHVALGLHSFWVRRPGAGGYPWSCALGAGEQSKGDRSYRTLCSRHWRRRGGEHSVGAGRLNPSRAARPACGSLGLRLDDPEAVGEVRTQALRTPVVPLDEDL
jgi:hypothetical protein